jgi:hypothetical protein
VRRVEQRALSAVHADVGAIGAKLEPGKKYGYVLSPGSCQQQQGFVDGLPSGEAATRWPLTRSIPLTNHVALHIDYDDGGPFPNANSLSESGPAEHLAVGIR